MSVLKEIIENNSTPKGKLFDYFIQALIVLSLISLSIETLPDLSSSTREFLYKFEVTCIIIFSIEYFLCRNVFLQIQSQLIESISSYLLFFEFFLRETHKLFQLIESLKLISLKN